MNTIYILTDYKGQFGSKSDSGFYRSGMDLEQLKQSFIKIGFEPVVLSFTDVSFSTTDWKDKIVIYTSQEDDGYIYKSYIEDVVYALELAGAKVIPKFKYLRSNNNKVFMELIRDQSNSNDIKTIKSHHFGTVERLEKYLNEHNVQFPVVIKSAEGAQSQGVYIGRDKKETIANAKKASKNPLSKDFFKDKFRPYKHDGYVPNSNYRRKYIIQNFVKGLTNDWKMLIFGDKFYIEYRGIRDNDFRASGSQRFRLNDDIPVPIPPGIFEFAEHVRNTLNTPHLSIDIGYVNKVFYLFEFQALYFSSYAHRKSTGYYVKNNNTFQRINQIIPLEQLYAEAVGNYLKNNCTF